MRRFPELYKRILKTKASRRLIIISVGLITLLLMIEWGLNFWIRSGLHRSLATDRSESTEITSKISWLGLKDILAGKVNRVTVNAKDCVLSDLRYSQLLIDSQGFRFDLAVLLKRKELKIMEMKKTRINGIIKEAALNEYLGLRYPEYKSSVKIKPGGLILSGSAQILDRIIPVELEGDLRAISGKRLRFYPTRLLIANSNVSGSLLRIVSEQVPLEFRIMEEWPLKVSAFKLEAQEIKVAMEEFET